MWSIRKKRPRKPPEWLAQLGANINRLGIRISIWLHVKTARLPLRQLLGYFGFFSVVVVVFNVWLIIQALTGTQVNTAFSVPADPAPFRTPVSKAHMARNNGNVDSVLLRRYLDSLHQHAQSWDSMLGARPGLQDSIDQLKQFYHIYY